MAISSTLTGPARRRCDVYRRHVIRGPVENLNNLLYTYATVSLRRFETPTMHRIRCGITAWESVSLN